MIMAYRFVRLIETHSEGLAKALRKKIENCPKLVDYHNVPAEELTERVYEVYRHLGEWLLGKTEADIEQRYSAIGKKRAQQGVPSCQVTWTICLVKENLWDYLKQESVIERPAEIFGELEVLELLDQFFDRAIYYAAVGHEQARVEMAQVAIHS
ncbi:conserved hypothetical protein [Candidatus Koribacter versatilis Ellin345]|uniref:RsbT co-antagonist protein RsbRD N-terminal domain-containing protein n=2 Tax=Candidatus Korobacter versatilis TaxID=658062 RepID=Q1IT48_KORVE|nr:conserved hypothetical protein [Candidatus Koribacter versatilis Ellin345]